MRTNTLFFIVAAVLLTARSLMGGEVHPATGLTCSDCHVGDSSAPDNSAGASGLTTGTAGSADPVPKTDANRLCAQCHDGQTSAPDVIGANANGYVRQGGGLTTGVTPYEDYKGHTLGSIAVAPGGVWSNPGGLKCLDCHTYHAQTAGVPYPAGYTNGQWLNLTPKPGSASIPVAITYATGANNPLLDVFVRSEAAGQLHIRYSVDNVDFNDPRATKSAYAQWCKGCHTNFHGAATEPNMRGAGGWLRHPTAGANIGANEATNEEASSVSLYRSRANRVKVQIGVGLDRYTPSCMSCHKAHGNQNPFGLIYMSGEGTVTEEGDTGGTRSSVLCRQCHVQGAD